MKVYKSKVLYSACSKYYRPHYRRTDIGSYKWCTMDIIYARNIPFYSKQQTRILKESKSKKNTDTYFKFKIKMFGVCTYHF